MKYSLIILTTMFLLFACNEDEPLDQTPKEETEETTDETETEEETEEEEEETEEEESPQLVNPIDLTDTFLSDFVLNEADRESITIVDPVLSNGVEETRGTISILVPWDKETEVYSLKEVNFDTEKFTIEPAVGEEVIIPGEPITYAISVIDSADLVIHYDVTVNKEEEPVLAYEGFKVGGVQPYAAIYDDAHSVSPWTQDSILFFIMPEDIGIKFLKVTYHGEYDKIVWTQENRTIWNNPNTPNIDKPIYRTLDQDRNFVFDYPRLTKMRVTKGGQTTQYIIFVQPENPLEAMELFCIDYESGFFGPCGPVEYNPHVDTQVGFEFRNVSNSPSVKLFHAFGSGIGESVEILGESGPYANPKEIGIGRVKYNKGFEVGVYKQSGSIDLTFDYAYGVILDKRYLEDGIHPPYIHPNYKWENPKLLDIFENDFEFTFETEVVPDED